MALWSLDSGSKVQLSFSDLVNPAVLFAGNDRWGEERLSLWKGRTVTKNPHAPLKIADPKLTSSTFSGLLRFCVPSKADQMPKREQRSPPPLKPWLSQVRSLGRSSFLVFRLENDFALFGRTTHYTIELTRRSGLIYFFQKMLGQNCRH